MDGLTFALPDLRGRVPIHQGQGPGLSSYVMGQRAGEENHTLISGEIPVHLKAGSFTDIKKLILLKYQENSC